MVDALGVVSLALSFFIIIIIIALVLVAIFYYLPLEEKKWQVLGIQNSTFSPMKLADTFTVLENNNDTYLIPSSLIAGSSPYTLTITTNVGKSLLGVKFYVANPSTQKIIMQGTSTEPINFNNLGNSIENGTAVFIYTSVTAAQRIM